MKKAKSKKKPAGPGHLVRPPTGRVHHAPYALMAALSRDLFGGEQFGFVLHRREAQVLSDVLKCGITSYNDLQSAQNLHSLERTDSLGFMNPAHCDMRLAARIAALRGQAQRRAVLLGPVGTGTTWFDDYVWGRSDVYFLRPRIPFEGFTSGHRSDFFAARFPPAGPEPRLYLYDWKTGERRSLVPSTPEVR